MRIILGSILLTLAVAAPMDTEVREARDLVDKGTIVEPPMETINRPRKVLRSVIEVVTNFRYIGIQDGAILEFFLLGFGRKEPDSEEAFSRVVEWGKKWNIEWTKTFRYDAEKKRVYSTAPDLDARDSHRNLVWRRVDQPTRKTFATAEEYNALAIKHEDLLRFVLQQEGLPEKAVEEYMAASFHLLPIDRTKYERIYMFCRKWDVSEVEAILLLADVVLRGAEDTPVSVTEATTEANEIDKDTEAMFRSEFRHLGLPEEAFDEYIAGGFHLAPFTDDKKSRYIEWRQKWTNVKETATTTDAVKSATVSAEDISAQDIDTPVFAPEATTAKGLQDTTNDSEIDANKTPNESEAEVRAVMQRSMPEEAIEEYIAAGLHLPPFDEDKSARIMEWIKKWTLGNLKFINELAKLGFPKLAREEFISEGLSYLPYDEEKQERYYNWMNKWKHTSSWYAKENQMNIEINDKVSAIFFNTYMFANFMHGLSLGEDASKTYEKAKMLEELSEYENRLIGQVFKHVIEQLEEKPHSDVEHNAIENKVISEVVRIFANTKMAANVRQGLASDGDAMLMTQNKQKIWQETGASLTEYERNLAKQVFSHVKEQVGEKYQLKENDNNGNTPMQ